MCVYKDPRSDFYTYEFQCKGQRYKLTTNKTTKRDAERDEKLRREQVKRDHAALGAANPDAPKTLLQATERYYAALGTEIEADALAILEYLGRDKALLDLCDNDVDNLVQWKKSQFKFDDEEQGLVGPARVNHSTTKLLRRIVLRAVNNNKSKVREMPNWSTHLLDEPRRRKRKVTANEHSAIAESIDEDYGELLKFALVSGLRQKSSLLEWANVDFDERKYKYIGKGGHLQEKPMTPAVEQILRSREGHHPEFVFTYVAKKRRAGIRARGQRMPITKSGLKDYWAGLKDGLSIDGLWWHDLRRSFASNMLRMTGNLALVQTALDHQDPNTTLRYAMLDLEDLSEGMAAAERTFIDRHQVAVGAP